LLESQEVEEKRIVVARLDFWREEFCGKVSMSWFLRGRRRMRSSLDFPIVIYLDDVEQEKVEEGEQLLVEFFEGT
jgi:hypothetical protein